MKKIYLLSFLMVIVGISCEKETVITISNESFEEYFPYHENGKSYNEPFRYVGEDKNGDPIYGDHYMKLRNPSIDVQLNLVIKIIT